MVHFGSKSHSEILLLGNDGNYPSDETTLLRVVQELPPTCSQPAASLLLFPSPEFCPSSPTHQPHHLSLHLRSLHCHSIPWCTSLDFSMRRSRSKDPCGDGLSERWLQEVMGESRKGSYRGKGAHKIWDNKAFGTWRCHMHDNFFLSPTCLPHRWVQVSFVTWEIQTAKNSRCGLLRVRQCCGLGWEAMSRTLGNVS